MYSVREITPPGFINTTPDLVSVTVTPGGAVLVDFGNARPGQNGQFCASSGQCLSMNCVEQICCDTACTESGHTCKVPGREGTCLPIKTAPVPALSGFGKVVGLAVLLLIAGAQLQRRRSRPR
jgi:hypothetical protein